MDKFKSITLPVIVGLGVVALLFVWAFCTETVEPGTEKVGITFGKVGDTALVEGLHIPVNPFTSWDSFDLKPRPVELNDLKLPAQDRMRTTVDATFNIRFLTGKTVMVRRTIGTERDFIAAYVDNTIQGIIIDVSKRLTKESSDYYADTKLDDVAAESMIKVNELLEPLGARIDTLKFSDIRLPDVIDAAVKKAKEREQQVTEQAEKLRIEDLRAQEKTMTAKAEAESAKFKATAIRATADAEFYKAKKVTDAKVYGITQTASATADSNKKIGNSVTKGLLEYLDKQAALKWDGKRSQSMTVLGDSAQALKLIK